MQTEQHVAGPVTVYYNSVQYEGLKQWWHIFYRWAYKCGVTCNLNLLGTEVNIPGDEGSDLVGLLSCRIGMEIPG